MKHINSIIVLLGLFICAQQAQAADDDVEVVMQPTVCFMTSDEALGSIDSQLSLSIAGDTAISDNILLFYDNAAVVTGVEKVSTSSSQSLCRLTGRTLQMFCLSPSTDASIVALDGRIVVHVTTPTSDLSSLPAGLYLLRVADKATGKKWSDKLLLH